MLPPSITKLMASLLSLTMLTAVANQPLSFEQMTADLEYLADDKLQGRGNFSNGIDEAAHYIAHRFLQMGLQPFRSNAANEISAASFLQKYQVYQLSPSLLTISLNGHTISREQTAFTSNVEQLTWHSVEQVSISYIGAQADARAKLSELNEQGGQHLVILAPSHQALFARYQAYFNRGTTKLSISEPATMLLVLSEQQQITQLQVQAHTKITGQSLQNVVAVLPAQQASEQYVLFSAHYDHLGIDAAISGDNIYNGADDDASGTSAVLSLAQYYKAQANNSRNLVFVAFSAEEIGGFGSRYFSQQFDPAQIIAMFNIEMIGKPSKFGAGTVWMTGAERSNLAELMNQHLTKTQQQIFLDPYPEQQLFYRSDNATLARLGVPAHSFSSTQLDQDQYYHQVSDDLSTIDKQSMFQVIKTLAQGAEPIVQGLVSPSRIDQSQVRAAGKIY